MELKTHTHTPTSNRSHDQSGKREDWKWNKEKTKHLTRIKVESWKLKKGFLSLITDLKTSEEISECLNFISVEMKKKNQINDTVSLN